MTPTLSPDVIEAACFAGSAALIAGYHLYLRHRVRHHDPHYTLKAMTRAARSAWVARVIAEGRDILAVQTLRNSMMAATFLASTAILLIIGVLTLTAQGERIGNAWHVLNIAGGGSTELWMVKLLLMLFNLLTAFFCFTMAIRLFNHVGYLINAGPGEALAGIDAAAVAAVLNRGGDYFGFGMRAYYFLLPLLFWLFGPQLLVLATLALIVLLYRIDRSPESPAAG